MGIFLGGSQALVLGTTVSTVSLVKDEFGDTLKNKLAISRNGVSIPLDENKLGGGEVTLETSFWINDLHNGHK
eukprot:gene32132-36274_t